MAAWLTDTELAASAAAELSLDSAADLVGPWTEDAVPHGNRTARGVILGKLGGRGYSLGQIESWGLLREVHTELGLYFAFRKKGVPYQSMPETYRDWAKWLAELDTLALFDAAGAMLKPTVDVSEGPHGAGSGTLSAYQNADGTDRFGARDDVDAGIW